MSSSSVVFCTSTTSNLLHEAIVLVRSIRRLYPSNHICFDAIDASPSELQPFLDLGVEVTPISSFPRLQDLVDGVERYNAGVEAKRKYHVYKDQSVPIYRPLTYGASIGNLHRVYMLPRVMNAFSAPVMWIDTDTIFRVAVNKLLDVADRYDLTIIGRPTMPIYARYLASLYIISCTDRGRLFAKKVASLASKYLGLAWTVNQLCLRLASLAVEGLKVNELDQAEYNDCRLGPKAKIWHIKHNKRNKKYRSIWAEEMRRIGLGASGI